jgi:hypothetical protein
VSNYARGYYDGAKRQGFSSYQGAGMSGSYASAQPSERIAMAGGQTTKNTASRAFAHPLEWQQGGGR